MKTITKSVLALCMCCFVSFASAKDVYVSSGGNDGNDGTAKNKAVKSLTRVHELIEPGDMLYISGILDINAEPNPSADNSTGHLYIKGGGYAGFLIKGDNWDNVTFIGEDPATDGFTAEHASRVFSFDGGIYTFKNLVIKKGRDLISDGGCGIWSRNTTATFDNCSFEDNNPLLKDDGSVDKSNQRGGAVLLHGGHLNFLNCYFTENRNKNGGAILVIGGSMSAKGCIFEGNDNSMVKDSNGGAINFWPLNGNEMSGEIDGCLFIDNRVTEEGGAIAVRPISDAVNYKLDVTIKNSSFIGNWAKSRGGAIIVNNRNLGTAINVVVANSTFYDNSTTADGGNICLWGAQPNSSFNMVNSTVYGNWTTGNSGHGAGLVIMNNITAPTSNMKKGFYNCIFEGNYSTDTSGENVEKPSDFVFRINTDKPSIEPGEIEVENCFFGHALNIDPSVFPENMLGYTGTDDEGLAGLDDADYYVTQERIYCIPLLEDSPARTFGRVEYLERFGILESDQLGKARTLDGSYCVIGAVEATSTELDDYEYEFPPFITTGIENNENNINDIQIVIKNGVIEVVGEGVSSAKLTVINLAGAVVKQGVNRLSAYDLANGVYIIKAEVENSIITKKILK